MTDFKGSRVRLKAILKLPRGNDAFIAYAGNIVLRMTGNAWFPSPDPPLNEVKLANTELQEAQSATLSRLAGTATLRDTKRAAVERLLELLCAHVQHVADANPDHAAEIIESAGMHVKKERGPSPLAFTVVSTGKSGSVKILFGRAKTRASYEREYSLDGGKTWVSLGVTTNATFTVPNLPVGAIARFRYRVIGKDGPGDWSDTVSITVT